MNRAVALASATRSTPPNADLLRQGAIAGAVSGLLGGAAFGASMVELGTLESIATLVRAESIVVATAVHVVVAALVGAAFGLLIVQQQATAIDTLLWGIAYGAFFWFVGPLTLRPLLVGESVQWDIGATSGAIDSLLGHVVWGAATGLSLAAVRGAIGDRGAGSEQRPQRDAQEWHRRGRAAAVGAVAGTVVAVVLTLVLPADNELTAPYAGSASPNWFAVLALGALGGAGYAGLAPYSVSQRGPQLGIRLMHGLALGYLAWVLVALTVVPLDEADELAWTAPLVRARFEVLPGYLLFGALAALAYGAIAGGVRFLFFEYPDDHDRFAAGPQRLGAAFRGGVAGVAGGLVFTVVMVQIGALGRVSGLVGADSPVSGFVVHIGIAVFIGGSYALLFRRQSFDVRSGAGWGVAYGFFWWILGALTLLPVLLGGDPQWSADEAARAVPELIGHLGYGAALGVTFYLLDVRAHPWWINRSEAEAEQTRARRRQELTSAPALWAFAVFLSLFVPIVLAGS